jgi:hypothetical protein
MIGSKLPLQIFNEGQTCRIKFEELYGSAVQHTRDSTNSSLKYFLVEKAS